MRAYMGFDRIAGTEEGACLIFANSAREAKKLGFRVIRSWLDTEWIDMGIKWLKENYEYLKTQADQEMLRNGIPHVIDSPETCAICLLWGSWLKDGVCEDCLEEMEE